MSDRQFRLPNSSRKPEQPAEPEVLPEVTHEMSRAEFRALKARLQQPGTKQTESISTEQVESLRRHGKRDHVGKLPEPPVENPTEVISRDQVNELLRRGRAEQIGRLPDAAASGRAAARTGGGKQTRTALPAGPASEKQPTRWAFWRRRTKLDENGEPKKASLLREFGIVVAIALVLSVIVKTFLVQPFWIPSGSMENTMIRGDRVIVSKLTPGVFSLERGDVVVFADDEHWLDTPNVKRSGLANVIVKPLQFVGLYPEGDNHLIKRLIGLPGDRVSCKPGGKLTVNGVGLDEPYLYAGDEPCMDPFYVVVPPDRLWVMGDHRSNSSDSRVHDEDSGGKRGSIPISSVTGRAVAIVWPLGRMGGLSNYSSTFSKVPNQ